MNNLYTTGPFVVCGGVAFAALAALISGDMDGPHMTRAASWMIGAVCTIVIFRDR